MEREAGYYWVRHGTPQIELARWEPGQRGQIGCWTFCGDERPWPDKGVEIVAGPIEQPAADQAVSVPPGILRTTVYLPDGRKFSEQLHAEYAAVNVPLPSGPFRRETVDPQGVVLRWLERRADGAVFVDGVPLDAAVS